MFELISRKMKSNNEATKATKSISKIRKKVTFFLLGSYGSLARYPNVSRLIQVDDKTVVFASGDYADYQYLKEEMERLS